MTGSADHAMIAGRLPGAVPTSQREESEPPALRPNSFAETLRILPFLVVENLGYRIKESKSGVIFIAVEPLAVILLSVTVSIAAGRLAPPVGRSFLLFFASAIVPFYTSLHVAWRFRLWDTMPRLPGVSDLQLAASHLIGEMLLKFFVLFVCYAVVFASDPEEAIPHAPLLILASILLLVMFGLGIGLLNTVISSFIPIWSNVFFLAARAWLLFSGGLMIADNLPEDFRNAVAWVPLTHAIILYRVGQYPTYPHLILDVPFLVISCVLMLAVGLTAERATREWRNFK